MKTITCDRCKTTVAANTGARRSGKPQGWTRLTIAQKTLNSIPQGSKTHDLCEPCTELVEKYITGQEEESCD